MNQEVNSFFEKNKDKTLEEFKEKYENKILDDKMAFSKKVLKLYKQYLKEKILLLGEDEKELEKIEEIKKITRYLKEKQDNKLYSNQKIDNNKKKSNRLPKKEKEKKINKKEKLIKKTEKQKIKEEKQIIKKPKKIIQKQLKILDIKDESTEIEDFFEYEKNDSLEEFKANYNSYEIEDKLEFNEKLISLYNKYLRKQTKNLIEDKKTIFENQDRDQIKKIEKIIKYLKKDQERLLSEPREIVKKVKVKKVKKVIIVPEKYEKANEDLNQYCLEKAMIIFENTIKNKRIDSNFEKQANTLMSKLDQKDLSESEKNELYLIQALLKKRLRKINKENKKERKILKNIYNSFKELLFINENKIIYEQNPMFEIVDYFLNKEEYYMYLKNIVNNIPDVVNIKYNNKGNIEPIIFNILNRFIDNYKKLLKKEEHINKDYLKSIYMLFLNNAYLYLTKEEQKKIDTTLLEFLEYTKENILSSKRINAVKTDLKDMYFFKKYFQDKNDILEDYDEYRAESEINAINYYLKNMYGKRQNLTQEYSILFNDSYHAYSILNRKERKVLKIHVIDIASCINNYSLDTCLYNQTILKQIDDYIKKVLCMEKGGTYPTITYEITFNADGSKEKLKIYQSRIKVKNKYTNSDFISGRNSNINFYKNLYLRSNKTDYSIEAMDKYFESVLNDKVIEFINDNNLPFIYGGRRNINNSEIVDILKDLSHPLSKLNTEFDTIYKTIKNSKDEFHYELKEFEGEYDLSIINPINYVGLTIQRMFMDLTVLNSEEIQKKYSKTFEDLTAKLNYYNNYVDREVLKKNKQRLKKKQKMLF